MNPTATRIHQPPARLILVGGGGHALVVAEVARALGVEVVGFLDDDASAVLAHTTIADPAFARRLGGLSALTRDPEVTHHLAIGDLSLRERVLRGAPAGIDWAVLISEAAAVTASVRIGPGSFVGPMAVLHARAAIGEHCIVNTGAIVEHECVVEDNCHIAPGAVLGGRVRIGGGTLVGLGARIIPGVRIGERCVIGAGATVVADVADSTTVVGVPAKPLQRRS